MGNILIFHQSSFVRLGSSRRRAHVRLTRPSVSRGNLERCEWKIFLSSNIGCLKNYRLHSVIICHPRIQTVGYEIFTSVINGYNYRRRFDKIPLCNFLLSSKQSRRRLAPALCREITQMILSVCRRHSLYCEGVFVATRMHRNLCNSEWRGELCLPTQQFNRAFNMWGCSS